MSIRLTSSGLSFSVGTAPDPFWETSRRFPFAQRETSPGAAVRDIVETTPELSGYFSAVRVFVDTADTVYAAEEALSPDNAADFLAVSGIFKAPGEGVAVSPPVGGLRAAMKYDAEALLFLKDYYGARVSFYSPLQENLRMIDRLDMPAGGFVANITAGNVYIVRTDCDRRLLLTEAYSYETDADLVYYLTMLSRDAGIKRPRIRLTGPSAKSFRKVLRKYFRDCSCV